MADLDASKLEGRGVEDLLTEYEATQNAPRKEQLRNFLLACMAEDTPPEPSDRLVTIGSLEDMRAAGRVNLVEAGGHPPIAVLGHAEPDLDILLYDISGAEIFPNQTVIVDGLLLSDEVRHMDSFEWLRTGQGNDLLKLRNINRADRTGVVNVTEAAVTLSNGFVYFLFHARTGCISFGHFIFDIMSQLLAYDRLKSVHGTLLVPIITNDFSFVFKWPGMTWLFEALVGPTANVVHIQPGVRAKAMRAYTTNRLSQVGYRGISITGIKYFRQRLFSTFRTTKGCSSPKYIYVSRKDANSREASNIYEVERLLESYGFETILVADLSAQEAFDTFHDAKIIVGMHGSGLMYNVYSERPAAVIELSHPGFEWPVILACAAACGHTPIRVGYEGPAVDLKALDAALSRLVHPSRDAA